MTLSFAQAVGRMHDDERLLERVVKKAQSRDAVPLPPSSEIRNDYKALQCDIAQYYAGPERTIEQTMITSHMNII